MERNALNIIKGLFEEEATENTLISLYLALLDIGIENCVAEAEKNNFLKGINILYNDSIEHKEIIINILKKYKSL